MIEKYIIRHIIWSTDDYRIFHKEDSENVKKLDRLRVVEVDITMSETTDMINELSREDPQFAKGIQHYRQQYRYADAIEKLRKRAKLTQTQLGDLVGAPQSAVARWERGDANITMKTLEKIAEATHTQLDIKFVKDNE